MVAKKNQLVIPHKDGWAVYGEGNQRATRVTRTKEEAIAIAREIARNKGSDLIVQSREGKISSKQSGGSLEALFAQWDAEGYDKPDEWWDEFDAFLKANRMIFTPHENF